MMFNKICIIGLGLIGSSLARNIRRHNLARELVASDLNPGHCKKGLELDLVDEASTSLSKSVIDADLIVICTPVGVSGLVAEAIADHLKPGAIITDVGSVKQYVIDAMSPHLPGDVHFVPGHPIAGKHLSGPENGEAELFEKRWCLLTPLPKTDLAAVEKVSLFWQSCGAKIEVMDVESHDLILGITSHLPHLIAFTIINTINNLENDIKSEVLKYSAGGLHDFTRIAAADPTMWRDVFLKNKRAVLEILNRYKNDIEDMEQAIREDDGKFLFDHIAKARAIRKTVKELGPAGKPFTPKAEQES